MQHGGDLSGAMERYGGETGDWLDLSTGINPWPWPLPQLDAAVWQRLPGHDAETALIAAARAAYRVPDRVGIVSAPGTQALIQWLPHLAAPGPVAIVGPTYHEHAASFMRAGSEPLPVASLDQLPDKAAHAVLVNPNNPDGRVADVVALKRAAAAMRARNGWLIIDESFADLDPEMTAAPMCADFPVIVLRSFGKFHGLAGLRLGFAIVAAGAAPQIAAALGPWAVSGPALEIGRAALADRKWADGMREQLRIHAVRLDEVLKHAGLAIAGGTSLFRLVRHSAAHEIHDHLAKRHIWVRRFNWASDLLRFGLPPDDAALERLALALSELR